MSSTDTELDRVWTERVEKLCALDEDEISNLTTAGLDMVELMGELAERLDARVLEHSENDEWVISAEQAWRLTGVARNLKNDASSIALYANRIEEAADYLTHSRGSVPHRLAGRDGNGASSSHDPLLDVIEEMTDVQRLRERLGREPTKAETLTMFRENSASPEAPPEAS